MSDPRDDEASVGTRRQRLDVTCPLAGGCVRAANYLNMTRIGRIALVLGVAASLVGLTPSAQALVPEACQPTARANVLECLVPTAGHAGAFSAIDTRVSVIVPPGGAEGKPVVYLLHGVGDTYKTWVANTDIAAFVTQAGLDAVIVMPDGGKNTTSGWYSDWLDGTRSDEAFHHDVLISWVESTFQTAAGRAHRAIMGLSMGGFGALSYAARHPDTFGAAASFSGLLDTQMTGPAEGYAFGALRPYVGTPDKGVWGDPTLDRDVWSAHNPTALARDGLYRNLDGNLWLATGTGTPGGPAGDDPGNPAAYGIEHFIWQTNQSFKAALTTSGTPYHDLNYVGGLHSWPYWQRALHLVLPDVVSAIT